MSEISTEAPRRSREAEAPRRRDAAPACKVDFSTMCPTCQVEMQPVHSHYQCMRCGWRDSCCF